MGKLLCNARVCVCVHCLHLLTLDIDIICGLCVMPGKKKPKKMSLRNAHPLGGAIAILFYVFELTPAGTLPKKMCLKNMSS